MPPVMGRKAKHQAFSGGNTGSTASTYWQYRISWSVLWILLTRYTPSTSGFDTAGTPRARSMLRFYVADTGSTGSISAVSAAHKASTHSTKHSQH